MPWRIVQGPFESGDAWEWELQRGRAQRTIRVLKPAPDSGRELVIRHLNDVNPPDMMSLARGWDFVYNRTARAEIGFTQQRGFRGRWMTLAHRLNLPHWLQPRP